MVLADSTADILNVIAPVVVSGLFVLAIILGIFMKHQRKMVELLNPRTPLPDSLVDEVRSMRADIQRLEARVDALALSTPPMPQLSERLTDRQPGEVRL